MTIKEFNKKYNQLGGIKQLSNMKANFDTLKEISEYFGVSKERVRQWMIELFGEKYDTRYDRRDKRIEIVQQLIKKIGIENVKKMYPNINKDYLRYAIK